MPWWIYFMLIIYVGVCMFLIFVILIQSGKGGGLSSLAGASQGLSDALGSTGSERALNRTTTYCAVMFVVLAIILSIAGAHVARQNTLLGFDQTATPAAAPLSTQTLPPGAASAPGAVQNPANPPTTPMKNPPGSPLNAEPATVAHPPIVAPGNQPVARPALNTNVPPAAKPPVALPSTTPAH